MFIIFTVVQVCGSHERNSHKEAREQGHGVRIVCYLFTRTQPQHPFHCLGREEGGRRYSAEETGTSSERPVRKQVCLRSEPQFKIAYWKYGKRFLIIFRNGNRIYPKSHFQMSIQLVYMAGIMARFIYRRGGGGTLYPY